MHLASDFAETEGRIEMVADGVLGDGFNFGVRQAGGAEVIQGVLEKRTAQALIAMKEILTDKELESIAESFKSNDATIRARA